MAVPLTAKGVVLVAVGYDIAPKGSLFLSDLVVCGWRQDEASSVNFLTFQVTWM